MSSVVRNRRHIMYDSRRSFLNFGFWLAMTIVANILLISLIAPVRTFLLELHPLLSVPLFSLWVLGVGVTLKLARDAWWLDYLNEQVTSRNISVGADTLRSWKYTLDSTWLLTRTAQKKLGLLFIQVDRVVQSDEAKQLFADYLLERGVFLVCTTSSNPKKMA